MNEIVIVGAPGAGKSTVGNLLAKRLHRDFVDTDKRIEQQAGDSKVVMALSGGVDSTVAATLIHKAIGNNLFGIFRDNYQGSFAGRNSPAAQLDSTAPRPYLFLRVCHSW